MSTKSNPAADPYATERAEWALRGPAWDRQADRMAALAARLNQPLIEAAEVRPGLEILDLASGAGEPALTLAALVAPGGSVTASDLVEEMLAGARRRAEAAKLANLRFELADMEALPFAEASFDRITCRFGLMFPPDTAKALREARRVLRPGGLAAWMVWGKLSENTVFQVLDRVTKERLGASFLDREINPFRFAEPGSLDPLLARAGFDPATSTEHSFAPRVEAGTPFWRPTLDLMVGHEVQALPPAERAALDRTIEAAFAPHLQDGFYRLKTQIRIHVGHKPA